MNRKNQEDLLSDRSGTEIGSGRKGSGIKRDRAGDEKYVRAGVGRRRILIGMILIPVLAAAALLGAAGIFTEKSADRAGTPENIAGGAYSADATADAQALRDASGGEAGTEEMEGESAGNGYTGGYFTVPDPQPMQQIAFTDGKDPAQCRSVPVRIGASILGGAQEETVWAVFLPAEMADRPHIVFEDYAQATLLPLAESERLTGARLYENTQADQGNDVQEARTYSSGDRVEGLYNGSAFRISMISADGSETTEDLYVFSCEGTATMYLDTESGTMENIDADPTKETSEEAQFLVRTPDGSVDSAGTCSVSGHGNSTWKMSKRPYNLKLSEKQSVMGMEACKKLCLISNSFDKTNLLDRISAQIAEKMELRDTPDGEFVNLYLNGQYNGLYYLSQRPVTGGSVHIDKLDNDILEANGQSKSEKAQVPKRVALHEEGDRLKKWAFNWPREPAENTGGYLLQQSSRYDGEDAWFSTVHRRYRIMSPSYATKGEVEYLQEYMLAAERAIYSDDGIDPETGRAYTSFLDMESWEKMLLLEEFFVEWDAERWSFFITKDRGDPLLYCGPMWDFDHSAGKLLYGDYPETTISTLLFRDTRHGWMYRLLGHDEFTQSVHERWLNEISPMLHSFLEEAPEASGTGEWTTLEEETSAIASAAYMNNIRRGNDIDFLTDAQRLHTWLSRRLAFMDSYAKDPEAYCRVEYQFSWGSLTRYVLRGETLGFLPLAEYGETQIPSQIEKNEIIGWLDENGTEISADLCIDGDRVFTPEYRQKDPQLPQATE